MRIVCVFVLLLCVVGIAAAERAQPHVDTKLGAVEGKRLTLKDGRHVDAFLAVPYAKPPIGELRYAKPLPVQPWNGVLKAQEFGFICPQIKLFALPGLPDMNEDCLTLNVITPAWIASKDRLPVMFFVHGGGFNFGSSAEYGYEGVAQTLAAKGVIVVTINYRLASFGFFSTGDQASPGNIGLWDQTLALKWVKDNIDAFGGDGEQITVFGESAGGASVDLLMLSPHSRDFISKGIPMSGTANAPWAINSVIVEDSRHFAQLVGCTQSDSVALMACMQSKSVKELLEATKKHGFKSKDPGMIKFTPVIDGDFFPHSYEQLRKEAPKKTVMTGTVGNEGLMFTLMPQPAAESEAKFNHNFLVTPKFGMHVVDEFLEATMPSKKFKSAELIHKLAKHHYFSHGNTEKDPMFLLEQYTWMFGHFAEVVPTYRDAQAMLENDWDVYLYSFEYINPNSIPPNAPVKTATHAGELSFLFGKSVYHPYFPDNEHDVQMSEKISGLWAHFAKHGKPSCEKSVVQWEKLDGPGIGNLKHLNINLQTKMQQGYYSKDIAMWTKVVEDTEQSLLNICKRISTGQHEEL